MTFKIFYTIFQYQLNDSLFCKYQPFFLLKQKCPKAEIWIILNVSFHHTYQHYYRYIEITLQS